MLTSLICLNFRAPNDPDADVEVAPPKAPLLSVVDCLHLCKIPYNGSANWQDLEGKDVLRAVQRFRFQFPAVSRNVAEDYIFKMPGKQNDEITRRRKRRENKEARERDIPEPHIFRPRKNSKAAKAAVAAEEVCFLVS